MGFSFIRPPSVFGQILSVSESEPREGDFGTYQRIIIEVDTPDEAEPLVIQLPMPKGWPNKISDRSTLAMWFNRAVANDEGFSRLWDGARSVKEALKRLEQKFVEFQREKYNFGRDREFEYQTLKRLFSSQQEMLKAYAETMENSGSEAETPNDKPLTVEEIPANVLANAKTTWNTLVEAFGEAVAEEQFRAMAWPVPVDALLKVIK